MRLMALIFPRAVRGIASERGDMDAYPGVTCWVPSTPNDLVGLLWTALHEEDPTLILIPKHIMRVRQPSAGPFAAGFGRARIVQLGEDVSVVTWGNCRKLRSKPRTS